MNKRIIATLIITIIFLGTSIFAQAGSNNLFLVQQQRPNFLRTDFLPKIHFWVRGFINFSDGSSSPNGIPVKITDLNNGNSMVVYTQQTVRRPGYYLINIEDLNGNNGHTIFVNVSYGGCAGNNSVVVNTTVHGTNMYCNVTLYGNLPPNIPNQPTGPTIGGSGVSYTYVTNTTDSDGDDIYYWFDWNDGSSSGWIGPHSSGETGNASHSWNTTGVFQVKAKAKDEHGAERGVCWSGPLNVTIGNQPPNTPTTPFGPPVGDHGVPYNYSTNTFDPNGDNVSYGWDWDDGDPIEWSGWYISGDTCVMSHSWVSPGSFDVRVKAKDIYGNEGGWSPPLSVIIGNQAPNTPNTPSGPILLNIGVSGTYSTDGIDPDGDQVQYRFDWDAAGSHQYSSWSSLVPSGTTVSMSHAWSSGGIYVVKAQARDQYYNISGWSTGVSVFINSPPNTPSYPIPAHGAIGVGLNVNLSWICSDPDGDSLTYCVYFEADDPTPDVLVSENQTGASYDPGTMQSATLYYWQILVWDIHGAFHFGPVWWFVTNAPPVFGIPSPINGSTGTPLGLTWSIAINDPNGDLLSWTIQCSNGQTTSGTGESNGTKSLMLSGLAYATTYKVWVNATDPTGSGQYTRKWFIFTTRINLPPEFGSPTPAHGSTNNPLSFTWSIPISDYEGDLFSWTIQCSNGQTNSGIDETNGVKSLDLSGLTPSTTYAVWVNATDLGGSGQYTRRIYSFTTLENTPPDKPDRPSGETNGKINTEYLYTTKAVDADGDQVYYMWDWGDGTQSNWLGPFASNTAATGSHTWTTKGSYSIKVKAKDTEDAESDWSDPLPVTMPCAYNIPLMTFIGRFFERFPNAFPLLRYLMGY